MGEGSSCNTPVSLTSETSAAVFEAGVDTWRLLLTPADQRSVDAVIALTRGNRRPVVASHVIGYNAGPQLIWVEGHPGSKDKLAHGLELANNGRLSQSVPRGA